MIPHRNHTRKDVAAAIVERVPRGLQQAGRYRL